jgi:Rrf2 family protein
MSVIFSRSCEYGLRAVLYLATQPEGKLTLTKEISESLQIPTHFLAKIMQNLSRAGILNSYKGPNGGFELATPADQITPLHVIEAIDGLGFMEQCILGFRECSEKSGCPVHEEWRKIRSEIVEMLDSKTIADLVAQTDIPDHLKGKENKA